MQNNKKLFLALILGVHWGAMAQNSPIEVHPITLLKFPCQKPGALESKILATDLNSAQLYVVGDPFASYEFEIEKDTLMLTSLEGAKLLVSDIHFKNYDGDHLDDLGYGSIGLGGTREGIVLEAAAGNYSSELGVSVRYKTLFGLNDLGFVPVDDESRLRVEACIQ